MSPFASNSTVPMMVFTFTLCSASRRASRVTALFAATRVRAASMMASAPAWAVMV